MSQATESDMAKAVITYLKTRPNKKATMSEIRQAIKSEEYITLTKEDKRKSLTRNGEEVWEQIVRNIVCHKGIPGNAIYKKELIHLPEEESLKLP